MEGRVSNSDNFDAIDFDKELAQLLFGATDAPSNGNGNTGVTVISSDHDLVEGLLSIQPAAIGGGGGDSLVDEGLPDLMGLDSLIQPLADPMLYQDQQQQQQQQQQQLLPEIHPTDNETQAAIAELLMGTVVASDPPAPSPGGASSSGVSSVAAASPASVDILASSPGASGSSRTRQTSRSSDEGISMSPKALTAEQVIQEIGGGTEQEETRLSRLESTKPKTEEVWAAVPVKQDPNPSSNLCYVCKEKAGKHSYYGGRVCPSCRAFFRRAVQSKYYEIFFCTKGERCEINLNTRRSCQYCRFKKCLESGMRIAWVLPDGERTRKYNKMARLQKEQEEILSRRLTPLRRGPSVLITQEEWALIGRTQQNVMASGKRRFQDFLATNHGFLREFASLLYFGGKISYNFYRDITSMCNGMTLELFMGMEEFRSLPIGDRRQLLEVNGGLLQQFKTVFTFSEKSCYAKSIDCISKSGKYPVLNDIVEKVQRGDRDVREPKLEYHQFYSSPWAATLDDEKTHLTLTQRMREWPRDTPSAEADETMVLLAKLIIAFCTDFVELERPDIVQKVQTRYAYLLQRYLKYKYGEQGNARFLDGLMLTSVARQADEIQSRRLPV